MNLGLGHLTDLKTHLLNEALRSATTYDGAIAALGLGVARRFEQYCARKFGRVVGETYEFSGEKEHVILPRYPIEEITAVAMREDMATGWVDQGAVDTVVEQVLAESGLVRLACPLGGWRDRSRLTYTGGYWYPTTTAIVIVTGSLTLAAGASATAVSFASAFEAVPVVRCQAHVADDSSLITATPYAVTSTGFTLRLASPAPTGGLTVTYTATLGGEEADPATLQQGSASLALAAESKAITFGTAFASAPIVTCNVVSPSDGLIIASAPTSVTTAGFTALLGFPIPATGYTLAWQAVSSTTTTAAPTLPSGATALPEDLKLAWLLQCEHLWKLRDVQGTALAESKAGVSPALTLATANLIPEVKAILDGYVRYSLS